MFKVILSFFIFLIFWISYLPKYNLIPEKIYFFHYDFIEINLPEKIKNLKNLYFSIEKKHKKTEGIGKKYFFKPIDGKVKIPCPWNLKSGIYTIKAFHPLKKIRKNLPQTSVIVLERKQKEFNKKILAITWENNKPLRSLKIPSIPPEKKYYNYKGIFKWLKFLGANTLFYITGQTFNSYDKIWLPENIKALPAIAREAKKYDLNFGPWISCYLTYGGTQKFYKKSYNYNPVNDSIEATRGISITDRKRIIDIVKLIKKIDKVKGVDFIGLDYIRPVKGGFELVDDFVREMGIEVPEKFFVLSKFERMRWLGRKIKIEKDYSIIDKWNWYRARRMSLIIKEIIERVNTKKPFFAFTLSWRKGWEHGQDLIMFKDAGIDFFNLMLYECTEIEFKKLISQLKNYLRKAQLNLNLGNQIDWIVHQYEEPGPMKFYERLKYAYENLKEKEVVKGFFLHDLSRSFWGRIGKYSYTEWLFSGASIFNVLREKYFSLNLSNNKILIENLTDKPLKNINYLIYTSSSVTSGVFSIEAKNKKILKAPPVNLFIRIFKKEPYFFVFYRNLINNPLKKIEERN